MTKVEIDASPFREPPGHPSLAASTATDRWSRLEAMLERASEWLNPILVKEARQALKSRQFVVTFTLLLICGWGWSLAGIAMLSQAAYYAPGGRFMLTGYFLILAVPLIVIVPFSAFRSLAAEREDGTFELLSITTLQSRQIISGKLGSAVVQMIVYYSALAPCIAFTYLLRGIDVLAIGLILFYMFLLSVLLSQYGLITATITRARHWQVLLSVKLILFLAWCDVLASVFLVTIFYESGLMEFDNIYFWIAQLAVLMFYASTSVLMLLAAAAQISFPSDNRSTKLRILMLIQHFLWIGWMTYAWIESRDAEVLYPMVLLASIYWFLAGSLLSGEGAQLSPRVKRSLPQSYVGRALFTWFNPGSGTGYVFTVLNVWSLTIVACISALVAEASGNAGIGNATEIIAMSTLCAAYLTAYLGAGRLVVISLRGKFSAGLILPLLVNGILAMMGVLVPMVAMGWWNGFSNLDYSVFMVSNWAWTINEVTERTMSPLHVEALLVYTAAIIFLVINLVVAMREVEQVRMATPQRVLDDEWELHPEKAPGHGRHPSSPWDVAEA